MSIIRDDGTTEAPVRRYVVTPEMVLRVVGPVCPRANAEFIAPVLTRTLEMLAPPNIRRAAIPLGHASWETGQFRTLTEAVTHLCDGYRGGPLWRGRGLFHLTHEPTYLLCERDTGIPLSKHPELAATPEHMPAIAVWFWRIGAGLRLQTAKQFARVPRGVNLDDLVDQGRDEDITLAIQGDDASHASRAAYAEKWAAVLAA